MIPNNNFYGKKYGKTIRDFSLGLDYKINNPEDRVEFIKEKLEIKNINGMECAHDFFTYLFDQTFDTQLDKDGVYWVEQENKYMQEEDFRKWATANEIDIADYLDIQTGFDNIEYDDCSQMRGSWNYSNQNTSSVKILLTSNDSQYTESNIAKEISKMADYILAKDKKKKDNIKIYSEKDFIKRIALEKQKMEGLEKVNDGEFAILKRVKNYRLAPKMEIHKSDYKLPLIYRNTYEDYLRHWNDHQFVVKYVDGKYKRIYINSNDNTFAKSVCMSKDQWEKGKRDKLQKIKFLEEANANATYMKENMELLKKGEPRGTMTLSQLKKNMGSVKDYMTMVKTSYDNYVCITPEKCPNNSNLMDIIDYTNTKHIEVLMSLSLGEKSIDSDISILTYDINKAIERAYAKNDLTDQDLEVIGLLRRGVTKRDIAKKINVGERTVFRRLEKIISSIQKHLL